MPIYEYTCKACNAKFEQLVKSMSATGGIKCPKCGSSKTEKALSVFAVGAEAPKSSGHAHGGGCGCCANAGSCPMAE